MYVYEQVSSLLVAEPPPRDSIIRVMAIHKAPEMITENLTCCPKHVDEQKRAGGHQLESSVAVCVYSKQQQLSLAATVHFTLLINYECTCMCTCTHQSALFLLACHIVISYWLIDMNRCR